MFKVGFNEVLSDMLELLFGCTGPYTSWVCRSVPYIANIEMKPEQWQLYSAKAVAQWQRALGFTGEVAGSSPASLMEV